MDTPIFKGRVVTLVLETAALPNGKTVELEIIHHPGAAAIVPLKDDGTVVLVHQQRQALRDVIYEIPAGKLSPGEDPLACAARELEEEIGYRAGAFELLTSIYTAPGFCDEVIHIYLGTRLTPGTQQLDQDEVLEVVEMPLERALALIREGVIRDAKTIVGLQTLALRGRGLDA